MRERRDHCLNHPPIVRSRAMPYVPVIDVSRDPDVVGRELDEVCRTVGFFQIVEHGVAPEVADAAWNAARRFFDLPVTDKMGVARPRPDYPYGYIPVAGESLAQSSGSEAPPDLKEVFNAGPTTDPRHVFANPDEASLYAPNLWPRPCPNCRKPGPATTRLWLTCPTG
jgi:isopenicillin N synthase-like dioxygenase